MINIGTFSGMILFFINIILFVFPNYFIESYPIHKLYQRRTSQLFMNSNPKDSYSSKVKVFSNSEAVGSALCKEIVELASKEINDKNAFYIAVPGGSVLKLLAGLKIYKSTIDWSKVFLFYVNHKCVAVNDPTSTHFKAKSLFLDELNFGANVFPITSDSMSSETNGHDTIAHYYQGLLSKNLPSVNKIPSFDYMLLGMGKDGHIGSLYPGRKETLINDGSSFVLSVDKKVPASITLSLPVMNNAKSIRVVLMGADKREALQQGLRRDLPPVEFPVCGVDPTKAVWLVDKPCAEHIENTITGTVEFMS